MAPGDAVLDDGADRVEADDEPPLRSSSSAAVRVVGFDERTEDATPVDLAELGALLAAALVLEGAPVDSEASLRLVDETAIAALKTEHLDGDGGSTDVLSFPVDGTAPDAELIGDVVLCPAVAVAQAAGHAGNLEDELALLVVHSALHLAGWDHADDEDRRAMWERERAVLVELDRPPERDPWSAQ